MTAGDLLDRVRWERPGRTDGDTGEEAIEWVTVKTTWAKVEGKPGGGEGDEHAQQTTNRTTEITLRGRTVDGLAETWRAVWTNRGNRVFNVIAVNPHPNGGEFMIATCTE